MNNRKIEQKKLKQIVIDAGLHQLLKLMATKHHTSIKTLVEGCLAELLAVDEEDKLEY